MMMTPRTSNTIEAQMNNLATTEEYHIAAIAGLKDRLKFLVGAVSKNGRAVRVNSLYILSRYLCQANKTINGYIQCRYI